MFSATAICAQPVSLPIYKLQFFIIGSVSLMLNCSNEIQFFSGLSFLNLFIKSISLMPPAK